MVFLIAVSYIFVRLPLFSKGKIDKNLYVFGEEPEEGEDTHFKGRIKQLLRGTLSALLTTSDVRFIYIMLFLNFERMTKKYEF